MKFLNLLLITLAACGPRTRDEVEVPPPPNLPERDGIGTPLGDMCAKLRALGCPEGEPKTRNGRTRTCYQTMFVADGHTLRIPAACVTRADDQEAVRRCGDPRLEVTFRCGAISGM